MNFKGRENANDFFKIIDGYSANIDFFLIQFTGSKAISHYIVELKTPRNATIAHLMDSNP